MLKMLTGIAAVAMVSFAAGSTPAGAFPAGPLAGAQADQSYVQDVASRRRVRVSHRRAARGHVRRYGAYRYAGDSYRVHGPYAYFTPYPSYGTQFGGPYLQLGPLGVGVR